MKTQKTPLRSFLGSWTARKFYLETLIQKGATAKVKEQIATMQLLLSRIKSRIVAFELDPSGSEDFFIKLVKEIPFEEKFALGFQMFLLQSKIIRLSCQVSTLTEQENNLHNQKAFKAHFKCEMEISQDLYQALQERKVLEAQLRTVKQQTG